MTADEAAQTWFTRAGEILDQYKAGPSATLWYESSIAAQGASALLTNRWDELSESARTRLQQMVNTMAEVNAACLANAQGSPLSDAAEEFYYEVRRRVIAGAEGLKDAADIGIKTLIVVVVALAVIVAMK